MSHSLYAQSGNDELEELDLSYGDAAFISIATGRSKPINKAPAVATIITAQQIQEIGARTIDEVLESVPGLHVSASSTRLSPIYSIRGIHTDRNPQVLMLLNGVPMTQLYFGDRGPVSSMPVNAISRIEIIRGPSSAIYGADAFAGVINVITKSADDYDGSEAGVRIGEFGTRDLWISNGMELESGLKTAFSLQYMSTDGDDSRIVNSDAQTVFDGFFTTSASNAPGSLDTHLDRVDLNVEIGDDRWNFKYWSRHLSNVGGGPGVALALDPEGDGDVDQYLLDFTLENLMDTESWTAKLNISYQDVNNESESILFPAGTVLPIDSNGNINPVTGIPTLFMNGLIGNPDGFEERSSLEIIALSKDLENHVIRIAAGISNASFSAKEEKNFGPGVTVGTLTNVTGTDFIYIKDQSRDVYYLSFQDEINIASDWELTAGVRYDDYSDFGSTTNPRVSLVWDTLNNLTTKFLLGRAFRAPSFAELFAINNPIVLGNPDLDPEIINTFEIAFDYSPGLTHHAGISIYTYNIEDLIQFVTDGSGASIAQNTGEQSGHGIEFEWVWNPKNDLSLSGNISLAKATDEETNADVANFPEKQLYVKAIWQFLPGWKLVPELHHVADRNRAEGDPRASIDDYTVINLAMNSTSKDSKISWSFGVKNLTDEESSEPSPFEATLPTGSFMPDDFPNSSRMVYATGQVKF
jgi:iron complex outermembrane receptor protein